MIHQPGELYVENGVAVTSLEIVDAEGVSQIVKFRDPMTVAGAAALGFGSTSHELPLRSVVVR